MIDNIVYVCNSDSWTGLSASSDTFYIGSFPQVDVEVVSYQDSIGICPSRAINSIRTHNNYEAYTIDIDTIICRGSSITVAGEEYSASTTITDQTINGCDSSISLVIDYYDLIPLDLEQDLCEGQRYEDIPGYSFTEDIDTTIIFTGGSYFGCDSTINLQLRFENTAIGRQELNLCYGESMEIDGVIFDVDNTTAEVPYTPGSVFGCDSVTIINANVYPEVTPGNFSTTLCPDESYPLGDMVYDINNSSGTSLYDYERDICANETIIIGADTYDATTISGISSTNELSINGCDSVLNVQLTVLDLPTRAFSPELCEDQDFDINGTIYNFSRPSGEEYVANTNGCDSLITISITERQSSETELNINLCMDIDTLINGEIYNASNTMGSALLQNEYNCDSTVIVNIAIADPAIDYITDFCPGDSEGVITLTDVAGINLPFELTISGTIESNTVTSLPYSLGNIATNNSFTLLLDDGTCTVDELVVLDSGVLPMVDIIADQLGPNSFQLDINTTENITAYTWSPAAILSCNNCPNPLATLSLEQNVSVTITSDQGCDYTSNITLTPEEVIDTIIKIYTPNVISLSDPFDDQFYVMSNIAELPIKEMMIYDRWGNKVYAISDFLANNTAVGWDGRFNGQPVEQGVYIYVLSYDDPRYGETIEHGSLTVIR